MKRTVLFFGMISGAISSLLMIATSTVADRIGFDHGEVIGYTGMVLAFLMVFFGIRSYRDKLNAGQITFAKGFTVGIAITLISCVCYVITWEIIYFNFMHDFMDKYGAHLIAKAKASGATPQALQQIAQQVDQTKRMYENPLYNAAITFLEPFPVGLIVTVVSAAWLRRRPLQSSAAEPLPTA